MASLTGAETSVPSLVASFLHFLGLRAQSVELLACERGLELDGFSKGPSRT